MKKPTDKEIFEFLDSLKAISTINEELSDILRFNYGINSKEALRAVSAWESGFAV